MLVAVTSKIPLELTLEVALPNPISSISPSVDVIITGAPGCACIPVLNCPVPPVPFIDILPLVV